MKILVADDHEVVREGLKQIVSRLNAFSVVDEASDGNEALKMIERNSYDMAIMDISMPGKSGLDVLQILRDKGIKLPVLILSIHSEEQYAIRVLKLGAHGYLCKNSVYKELASAISTILDGRKYISQFIAETVLSEPQSGLSKVPHEKLSPREFQVMCMIARGESLNEIANSLFISSKTVSTHRARILEKMNMGKNADIINYAIKNNLVE
ncbi:MAG: response regulator transcription factor [Bacteroidales bacterium]